MRIIFDKCFMNYINVNRTIKRQILECLELNRPSNFKNAIFVKFSSTYLWRYLRKKNFAKTERRLHIRVIKTVNNIKTEATHSDCCLRYVTSKKIMDGKNVLPTLKIAVTILYR